MVQLCLHKAFSGISLKSINTEGEQMLSIKRLPDDSSSGLRNTESLLHDVLTPGMKGTLWKVTQDLVPDLKEFSISLRGKIHKQQLSKYRQEIKTRMTGLQNPSAE